MSQTSPLGRKQAKELGWEAPKTLELCGPPLPELTHEQRISRAYETALPFLADQLEHKSVLTHWDLQVAAARGLVNVGSRDVAGDLLAVTKKMRDDGVWQYGEQRDRWSGARSQASALSA